MSDRDERLDTGLIPGREELERAGVWLDWAQEYAASPEERQSAQYAMRCVRGVLAGMGQREVRVSLPALPISDVLETLCRTLHSLEGTGDADSLRNHPADNSWDPPTLPRWTQWQEIVSALLLSLEDTGRVGFTVEDRRVLLEHRDGESDGDEDEGTEVCR